MKLQRLLVVIDTEHAEQPALLRATELARQTGAELHLLQVDYHPKLDGGLLDGHLFQRIRDTLVQQRHADLLASVAHLSQEGLKIEVDVRWSKHRHEEILARGAVLQPDILFTSAHPGNALRRLLFGDASWQLIRRCPVPLWLVHDAAPRGSNLCVALDPLHSADKPAALDQQLIATSQALQARLGLDAHYLHAQAPLPRSLMFDAEVAQEYEDYVTHVPSRASPGVRRADRPARHRPRARPPAGRFRRRGHPAVRARAQYRSAGDGRHRPWASGQPADRSHSGTGAGAGRMRFAGDQAGGQRVVHRNNDYSLAP